MMYGSFPRRSSERRSIVDMVEEMLPNPKDFPDKKSKEDLREKKARILSFIAKSDQIGVTIVPTGNAKIGMISQFSLPAGHNFRGATCPGATEFCERLCYAKRPGLFLMMQEWRYYVNWAYVTLFPDRFAEIWKSAALTGVVRIHVGGDFFHPDYVSLWSDIVRAREYTRFYAYTRSWQNGKGEVRKEFVGPLRKLAGLDNMRLVLSCDRETNVPPVSLIPTAIRAWLAADDQDLPKTNVELIFRDHSGMKATVSQMGGAPVCPVERSPKYEKISGKITCQNCGWCWGAGHLAYGRRDDELEMFNSFAGTDLPKRVATMFKGSGDVSLSGPAAATACMCGAEAPCVHCGTCAICRCRCY